MKGFLVAFKVNDPVLEHDDSVRYHLDALQVVGHDDGSQVLLFVEFANQPIHRFLDKGVNTGRGFVVENNFRVVSNGSGNGHLLFGADAEFGLLKIPHISQFYRRQQIIHPLLNFLFVLDSPLAEGVGDVFSHVEKIKNSTALENIGNPLAQFQELPLVHAGDIFSVKENTTHVGLEQTCDQLESDALSTSAFSQYTQSFPLPYFEADALEDGIVKGFTHIL